MDNQQLHNHIMQKKEEIGNFMEFKARLIELKDYGLSLSAYAECLTKANNRIVQCEISINDHEKLLKTK